MFSLRLLFCGFCVATLAGGSAFAASPVLRLTQRRAIALAIENNLAIKVAEFNPDIAEARITTERGAFDPTLKLDLGHAVANTTTDETQTGHYGLGIGGASIYGTEYNVGLGTGLAGYNRYSTGAEFSLSQPLLRGFGSDVNLAALHIARNNREISEWGFKQEIIDAVTKTVFVYNELHSALRNYDAAKRSRDLALQLCKEEEVRAQIGVKIELDVITAQAEAAAREEAVILAQNAIQNNERYLKQLVTCDTRTLIETRVEIVPPPLALVGKVDLEAGLREALQSRPDYQEALILLRNRHINVVTARNNVLPRLDLVASLNLLGLDSRDIADSMRFLNNSRNPQSWSVGAIFSLPIPNRSAKGRLKAAKLIDAQALMALQQLEQSIIVNVANAAGEITTARKRIDSTREALRLAKESLDAGLQRRTAGSATTFEVLKLQKAMTDAEAALIRAEADYANAVSEYDRQTGATLVRNSIKVAP